MLQDLFSLVSITEIMIQLHCAGGKTCRFALWLYFSFLWTFQHKLNCNGAKKFVKLHLHFCLPKLGFHRIFFHNCRSLQKYIVKSLVYRYSNAISRNCSSCCYKACFINWSLLRKSCWTVNVNYSLVQNCLMNRFCH